MVRTLPSRSVASRISKVMALSGTGQCSSQTMHSRPKAKGRQRVVSKTARPIFTFFFSGRGSGAMASVGQTWPQAWHSNSHQPMAGTSTGDHKPSRPASAQVGCNPPEGQVCMHIPHLTQRCRKSGSVRAPGGRIRAGLKVLALAAGVMRIIESAATPPTAEASTRRLPRSTLPADVFFNGEIHLKSNPWLLHDPTQFQQPKHSVASHSSGFSG